MKNILILPAMIFSLLAPVLLHFTSAEALSGSEFQAGKIIEDDKFFNASSMNGGDIQAFLNSKVANGSCDTNGVRAYGGTTRAAYGASRGYPAPYICLKDYSQNTSSRSSESGLCNNYSGGTKSAAQIIYDVGQSCGISPKVLLVLLEKEQSLITDDWPWPIQYNSATGFGCPDTAPCDAQYGAFFDQVYYAARQFKKYARDSSLFRYRAYRDNFIQYNPNTACGGTNVYLQNQATANLYNYTPYQPNSSALANLYGSGDGCGAYGNRNFWRLYNDWFGSTTISYAQNSLYARSACNIAYFPTNRVGRLYNPETRDYLWTTSHLEACLAIKAGYIWDGAVFENYSPSTDTTPVYRLVNYTRHLYTSSSAVKQDYISNRGYRDEGIAYYAKTTAATPNIPVYCFVKDDTVMYTSSTGEGSILQSGGFTSAGISYYTGRLSSATTDVYRLSRGSHRLYTTNNHEKDVAQLFYGFTWEYNAITKAFSSPGTNLTPVYRLSASNRHFYTTNRGERDMAVVFYGYQSEGTGFYAYPESQPDTSPMFRLTERTGNRLFTANTVEKALASTYYGYTDEGTGWYVPN